MDFNRFPVDCQKEIVGQLTTEDLISFTQVDKKWNTIAYTLIKYAELRHLTSKQLISKLINLQRLKLNFFDRDSPFWFYGLLDEMLLLTNLKRLRVELLNYSTDPSDITNPYDAPHFNILKQMTYLEQISFLSAKTPNLDTFFPGFSHLTSLSINAPFEQDCTDQWRIASQFHELKFRWTNNSNAILPLKHASNLTYLHIGFRSPKNRIQHMTNLKELSINYGGAPVPIECGDLTRLKQLETITFRSYDDTSREFTNVLPKLVWLRNLDVDLYDFTVQETDTQLAEISRLVNLTSLSFKDHGGLFPLASVGKLTNLRRFSSVEQSSDLENLTHFPNLEYLKYGGGVHGEHMERLAKLTSLTELDLTNQSLKADIIESGSAADLVFDQLPRVTRLTWIKTGRGGMSRTFTRSEWKKRKDNNEM